jgi:aldehyde:ferredoxin oxidoreductase
MKFLGINTSTKNIHSEDVTQEYAGLGGRGLTSIMINKEVPATCNPLGPENKLLLIKSIEIFQ